MPLRIPLATLMFAICLAPALSVAADLGVGPVPTPSVTTETAVHSFLSRRAVLYEIRRSFDVITDDEAAAALHADVANALDEGVSQDAIAETEDDLLGEASYFIVSLRYLVTSGFPAWPEDRSAKSYAMDSTAILAPLLSQLRTSIEDGNDASQVLASASRVYWWAEGQVEPRPDKADFTGIDAKVDDAIAEVRDETVAHT